MRLILMAIFGFSALLADDAVIEYQLTGNQYAVIVVIDGSNITSASQAKEVAMKRAAKSVVDAGDRYFTVDSEEKTTTVRSSGGEASSGNLYQESIMEGNFGRDSAAAQGPASSSTYPAIRLVYTSYKKKPPSKTIDACTLT